MTPQIYCRYTELRETDTLVEHKSNPNTHPAKQIEKLARVIELNGWRSPIVVSARSGYITKGHGRLLAAKKAGWLKVPVEVQDYGSEAEEYSDLIADNKISEYAELDKDILNSILIELGPDIDIDSMGLDAPDLEACADEELEKPMKSKTCPHCGKEIE